MAKKKSQKRRQRKHTATKGRARRKRSTLSSIRKTDPSTPSQGKGLGPESGGQSGDTQGLSDSELVDTESVEELVEEGQPFEASVVDSIENAPDPDKHEIETSEVPEDDVPDEYRDGRENR